MPTDDLLAAADRCVKCGLCLPYCPTYNKTGNENESPRGCIALVQAWASHSLPASPRLLTHIDNCLLCRACERVCPASVPYGRLIDQFRLQASPAVRTSIALKLLRAMVRSPALIRASQRALALYRRIGAGLGKGKRLQPLQRLLPAAGRPRRKTNKLYRTTRAVKGDVGLFKGCLGELLDPETLHAAIAVLHHAGYNVHLPEGQTCCGALDLHSGELQQARKLARTNIRTFGALQLTAIISIASGCGSVLQEYEDAGFSGKIVDISQFLVQNAALANSEIAPLPARIVLHSPCSLKNVMRQESGAQQLLEMIPEVRLMPLPEDCRCCGSAGSYMLEHPEMAQALLDDLLEAVCVREPDFLVTANIGCALHIAAAVRERGLSMQVVHPVTLIYRQLRHLEPGGFQAGISG
ncbi:(Fe-S)-binding protein [Thiolapillus sp.]|uniref:(Fe-S)-binding protein n=1 Tax=Thiolapillus sp. TaxID=2017437 RepID=UPI003AF40F09